VARAALVLALYAWDGGPNTLGTATSRRKNLKVENTEEEERT